MIRFCLEMNGAPLIFRHLGEPHPRTMWSRWPLIAWERDAELIYILSAVASRLVFRLPHRSRYAFLSQIMVAFTMRSIACAAAVAVTSAAAAALTPHPRDMTFLPRRAENTSSSGWPYGPFNTDGRNIVDSNGESVLWTGVNWPGSGKEACRSDVVLD